MKPDLVSTSARTLFRFSQDTQRAFVSVPGTHFAVKPRHGFDIVIENFDSGFDHGLERVKIAFEVGNQKLYPDLRIESLDPENGLGEMRRAAVGQVISVHRGDDDVVQTEVFDHQRNVARFFGIEGQRLAFVDGAEPTAARAGVAENQERRRLVAPALADVRAARLLANRVQVFLAHEALEAQVVGISRRFDFDPIGMPSGHHNTRQVQIVQAVRNRSSRRSARSIL